MWGWVGIEACFTVGEWPRWLAALLAQAAGGFWSAPCSRHAQQRHADSPGCCPSCPAVFCFFAYLALRFVRHVKR